MVRGGVVVDAARAFLNGEEAVGKVQGNVGAVVVQNLLDFVIILGALSIIQLGNGQVHQLVDLGVVVMRLVDAGARANQAAAVVAEDIHAAAVQAGFVFAVGRAGAQAGGVELDDFDIDADFFKLSLNELAAGFTLAGADRQLEREGIAFRITGSRRCSRTGSSPTGTGKAALRRDGQRRSAPAR